MNGPTASLPSPSTTATDLRDLLDAGAPLSWHKLISND